ncbi:hypothetical protein V1520DRAFT_329139 [Lipomyces starkeyi]
MKLGYWGDSRGQRPLGVSAKLSKPTYSTRRLGLSNIPVRNAELTCIRRPTRPRGIPVNKANTTEGLVVDALPWVTSIQVTTHNPRPKDENRARIYIDLRPKLYGEDAVSKALSKICRTPRRVVVVEERVRCVFVFSYTRQSVGTEHVRPSGRPNSTSEFGHDLLLSAPNFCGLLGRRAKPSAPASQQTGPAPEVCPDTIPEVAVAHVINDATIGVAEKVMDRETKEVCTPHSKNLRGKMEQANMCLLEFCTQSS